MTFAGITALVLGIVRLIESTYELSKTPEAKTVIEKLIQIIKNFMALETYKK